jgi:hypothetical protein
MGGNDLLVGKEPAVAAGGGEGVVVLGNTSDDGCTEAALELEPVGGGGVACP